MPKVAKLTPSCRQWPLFLELQRRPEGMTSLEALHFLADHGAYSLDIRDDLGTIRAGCGRYGWTMPRAEPDHTTDAGSKVYRYRLERLSSPASAAARGAAESTIHADLVAVDSPTAGAALARAGAGEDAMVPPTRSASPHPRPGQGRLWEAKP